MNHNNYSNVKNNFFQIMEQLYELAENENINVIERNMPDSFNGFFYREGKFNLICLKRRLRKFYKRLTFAHEIGYYFTSIDNVLFQNREIFDTCNRNEYLAKKWAAEYLIPKEHLTMYLSHLDGDYLNEYELADIFNVTPEFVRFRINILSNNN